MVLGRLGVKVRFKYKPFKFYDSFLQALQTNPKIITKDF